MIVEPDGAARAIIGQLLEGVSAVAVGDFAGVAEALIEAPLRRADVVVVRIGAAADEQRALRAVELLARTLPDISIVAVDAHFSADTVIGMVRAGAVEVLHWPLDPDELREAFETVRRARRRAPPTRPAGELLSVFSAKGGLGATTIATNTAVLLGEHKPGGTVLVELNGRPSDAATLLNVRVTYSVLDAFRNLDRLDESFLRGLIVRHDSGLWVLPGPLGFEPFPAGADDVRHALGVVRSHFDHVVLDLRHEPDEPTLAALAASDAVLFLTSLDVAALRASAAALAVMRDARVDLAPVRVVVVRAGTPEDVTLAQAEDTLNARIVASVAHDHAAVTAAVNSGVPVVSAAPRSRFTRSLRELVAALGQTGAAADAPARRSPAGRLRHALFGRTAGAEARSG